MSSFSPTPYPYFHVNITKVTTTTTTNTIIETTQNFTTQIFIATSVLFYSGSNVSTCYYHLSLSLYSFLRFVLQILLNSTVNLFCSSLVHTPLDSTIKCNRYNMPIYLCNHICFVLEGSDFLLSTRFIY